MERNMVLSFPPLNFQCPGKKTHLEGKHYYVEMYIHRFTSFYQVFLALIFILDQQITNSYSHHNNQTLNKLFGFLLDSCLL